MKAHWILICVGVILLTGNFHTVAQESSATNERESAEFTVVTRPDKLHPGRLPLGETLRYIVSFRGVPAGASVLRIDKGAVADGKDTIQLKIVSRTNKLFSVFYKTEDIVTSNIHRREFYSIHFNKDLNEKEYKRRETIVFDYEKKKARMIRKAGKNLDRRERVDIPIEKPAFDPLAALYYIRHFNLKPGMEIRLPVCTSKKEWEVVVQCIRRQRRKLVRLGEFDSVELRIDAKFEGIFIHKGEMRVWVDRRTGIILYGTVKIPIGTVTLTLEKAGKSNLSAVKKAARAVSKKKQKDQSGE